MNTCHVAGKLLACDWLNLRGHLTSAIFSQGRENIPDYYCIAYYMAYSYSESRFAYLAMIVSELSFCIIFTSDLQFFFKLLRLKNNNKKTVEKLSENIKSVRFPQASYPSQIFVY